MSLQTKRKVAQALSVPLFYIKSKTPRQLLTLYRRCTRGSLPFPSMRKQTFNGKIFLVPNTPLGRRTYAKVILNPNPLVEDLQTAASRLGIKGGKRVKKDILKQAILNKLIKLKVPEPVLFVRKRKPKPVVKVIKNSSPQPIRRVPAVFKNDIKIRNEINNINKRNRNRTNNARYMSNRQNTKPRIPPRPRVPIGNRTTTVRYVSNKQKMTPRIPPRPQVPIGNRTITVRHVSNKKNTTPLGPFITSPKLPNKPITPPVVPNVPIPRPPLPPGIPNKPNVPRPRPPLPPRRPNKPNIPNLPNVPQTPIVIPNVPKKPNVPNVPNTPGPVVVPIPSENRKLNTNALRQRIGKHQLKINNLKARINQKNSV